VGANTVSNSIIDNQKLSVARILKRI